jgi:O-antigen/teichoic acid export membrane protein
MATAARAKTSKARPMINGEDTKRAPAGSHPLSAVPQATSFVTGSLWAIAMRWSIRSAGLVSTVILARILTPADFGIVAMSSLVLGLLLVCSETGAAQLLLRTRETDRAAYDTAWSILLLQNLILAAAMIAMSYPAAIYFKEPRLTAVIQVVAAGSVLAGFNNIGVVMFRRDLDFRSDFLFGFFSKVLTVIPTLVLALMYRSYWSLVIGQIIGQALEVVISYIMHPFRPRFSLAKWRRFVKYSMLVTPAHVATFLNQKADVFIVGTIASTAQLGAYNVASELSRMATSEIVSPMSRAIFPNYAKLKDNLQELTSAFLNVVRTVALISFGFGFGIAAVAEDAVYLLLGHQWEFAVPLVQWLGIFGAFASLLSAVTGHILIVLKREPLMLLFNWVRLAIFTAAVIVAAHLGTVVDIAMAAALSTAIVTLAWLIYLPRVVPVPASRILVESARVLIAAGAALAAVRLLHDPAMSLRPLRLLMDLSVGASVFLALIALSWLAAGRPDGPERRLVGLLSRKLAGTPIRG